MGSRLSVVPVAIASPGTAACLYAEAIEQLYKKIRQYILNKKQGVFYE